MSEFLTYAPDLTSMTGGRGVYTMEFSHYDEVPALISEKLLVELNKTRSKVAVLRAEGCSRCN